MEPADDFEPALFPDLRRQDVTRTIELPAVETVEKVRYCCVSRIELAQHPDERFIAKRAQLLDAESLAQGEFHCFGNHRARRDLRVVEVDALGKRISNAEKIHQLGKRVEAQHAVLFEVHHEPAAVQAQGFEDAWLGI